MMHDDIVVAVTSSIQFHSAFMVLNFRATSNLQWSLRGRALLDGLLSDLPATYPTLKHTSTALAAVPVA